MVNNSLHVTYIDSIIALKDPQAKMCWFLNRPPNTYTITTKAEKYKVEGKSKLFLYLFLNRRAVLLGLRRLRNK